MFRSELALLLYLEMFLQCFLASRARISPSLAPSQALAALHTASPSEWECGMGAQWEPQCCSVLQGCPLLLHCGLGVSWAAGAGGAWGLPTPNGSMGLMWGDQWCSWSGQSPQLLGCSLWKMTAETLGAAKESPGRCLGQRELWGAPQPPASLCFMGRPKC